MEYTNLRKKRMIKITGVFIIVILGFTVLSRTVYELLLPQVTITRVSDGRIESNFYTTGQIGKDALMIKRKKVAVKMPESGIMTKCFVEEGQSVSKGQPLFTIILQKDDKEEIQEDYNRVETEMSLETVRRDIKEKTDKKGKIEVKIADKKAELEKNEKSYEMTELENQIKAKTEEVTLNGQLLEEGAIAKSTYIQSKEALNLLNKKKEQLKKDEKGRKEEELLKMEEELEGLESEIHDLIAKETLDDKKMEALIQSEKEMTVVSPISGSIYEVNLAEGTEAGKGEGAIVMIPKEIPITLTLKENQQQADQIKIDQEVTWLLNREQYEATVVKKTYDSEKDQIIITCKLDEKDISMMELDHKTYRTVDININSESEKYNQLINNTALVKENREAYIYIIKEDKKPFEIKYFAYKIPVTIIKEGDGISAISGELSNNEEIVKTASKPLHDGMEVNKK